MSTEPETLALERLQQDRLLTLIEKLSENPEISPEKLKIIVDLQTQVEDRQAEEEFDDAMLRAQDDVQELDWDKVNKESASKNRYVSYPKIDRMLRPLRKKYGFSQSYDTAPGDTPDMPWACCDVTHITTVNGVRRRFRRRYRLPMPIDASGPKGGGVMTKPQAVHSGMSYMMRKLSQMIWNIPLLIDKDDNDGNAVGSEMDTSKAQALHAIYDLLDDFRKKATLKFLAEKLTRPISQVEDIPGDKYNDAHKTFAKALKSQTEEHAPENAKILDPQVMTLQEMIEGQNCKSDFLAHFEVKKIGDLPSTKYQEALTWLEAQRRK